MKKLVLMIATVFATVSFSACSDDNINTTALSGSWDLTRCVGYEKEDNGECEYYDEDCRSANMGIRFNEDGTCQFKDGGDWYGSAKYVIKGKTLSIIYGGDSECTVCKITKLTANELQLYYMEECYVEGDGHPYYYKMEETRYYIRK